MTKRRSKCDKRACVDPRGWKKADDVLLISLPFCNSRTGVDSLRLIEQSDQLNWASQNAYGGSHQVQLLCLFEMYGEVTLYT